MVQGTASEHKAAMVYRDPELGQLEFWMSCDRVILVGWIGQRVRARGLRREAVIKKSPCPWYSREPRLETELHGAPGSRWRGGEFRQAEEAGSRAGVGGGRLSTTAICACARAKQKDRAGGDSRGGGRLPGELEEWGFPGASLRAETKDGWLHTGEQHEVLGEEPVHRHRALGPGRLLQANQQDQGQPRYRLPSPRLRASVNTGSFPSLALSRSMVTVVPAHPPPAKWEPPRQSVLGARPLVKQALLVALGGKTLLKGGFFFFSAEVTNHYTFGGRNNMFLLS